MSDTETKKEVVTEKKNAMAVQYQTRYGDELSLTFSMIRRYLVNGKKELVTDQEIVYFMHLCKARRLNPFLKDAYLVKYTGNQPASIITSVDYFRKHARKQPDCKGWNDGVIVKNSEGKIEYREGTFVAEGEKLVGGWAEAQPDGWEKPKKHSVNLAPYIKKKSDGSVTKFWKPDKQPDMICKVATCQLLRQLWGEEMTGMYAPEEMPSMEDVDKSSGDFSEKEDGDGNGKSRVDEMAEKAEAAKASARPSKESEPKFSEETQKDEAEEPVDETEASSENAESKEEPTESSGRATFIADWSASGDELNSRISQVRKDTRASMPDIFKKLGFQYLAGDAAINIGRLNSEQRAELLWEMEHGE